MCILNVKTLTNKLRKFKKKRGIAFDQDPTDQRWLWKEARLKDVDGNQLILFSGGKNRLNPPWRIENK